MHPRAKQLTEEDVIFTLECLEEHTPVRGNAMASGDNEADRACENEILERLDRGDIWAWCTVKVTARYGSLVGVDYLGCCSYRDERDFREPSGGYFDDMRREALRDLQSQIDTLAPLVCDCDE